MHPRLRVECIILFFNFCSIMTIKERYDGCLDYWRSQMPSPTTELHYDNPFQLLMAVMLSAQCTDKRINQISPALFEAFPTPQVMAQSSVEEIFPYIKSVSYPNSKAQHLYAMACMLVDKFHGQVPATMQELTQLPGVGRKTANVMLGTVFNQPAIPVDTHVFRVSNRIGLATGKTPLEVETGLKKHLSPADQIKAHHWILLHGRYVCKASKPDCLNCGVSRFCKTFNQKK